MLASGNQGKLVEIQQRLNSENIELLTQSSLGVQSVEETGLTFVENAILKARHAAKLTGFPAIADDSGLLVDALNGAPGLYTARYAGENATSAERNAFLLKNLQGVSDDQRGATFYSVMVFLDNPEDPMPIVAEGAWRGVILTEPKGVGGFGYDPVFYVPTHHCAAAEMDLVEKNTISHRGQALTKLQQALTQMLGI